MERCSPCCRQRITDSMNLGAPVSRYLASRFVRWLVFALFIIMVAGTAAYNYRQIYQKLTIEILAKKDAVARAGALTLAERFSRDVDLGVSIATRPQVRELVGAGKWDAAARYLHAVPVDFPDVERIFLADTKGILRSDTPALPNVRGVDFSYREWFKGVSREWRPYITSVYRRAAVPRINVFAVTIPINNMAGVVSGILVVQIRMETILDLVGSAILSPGSVLSVVDQKGQLVYRSDHESQTVEIFSDSSLAEKLRQTNGGAFVGGGLEKNEIVSYAPVAGYGWHVIIKQPVSASPGLAARNQLLRNLLLGYGLVLVLGGATFFFAARLAMERQRAADKLELRIERRRAAHLLADKDRLLTMVGSMAKVGGWEFDAQTLQGTWTEEVSRIHELDPDLEPGADIVLSCYQGDSRVQLERAVKDAIEQAKPYDLELELLTAKGIHKWVRTIGQPVVEKSVVVRVWGSFQDVTERKMREEEIHRLNIMLERKVRARTTELEAVNRELEAFSYSVSHDLRAPLRAIDGFSQALLEDYAERLDDSGKQFLGRVRAATQHMGELIDDLLQLSRVTRAELARKSVDLGALAETVLADLRQGEPNRQVEIMIQPGLKAYCDRKLLRIALVNLFSNAWKFTARKDAARIEFGTTDTEAGPAFFVRDNGVGFDMTYSDKLFGAFQRLHAASEFPGTGVGLATVKRVIFRHGGSVWADAAVDLGAAFYFTLPEFFLSEDEP